MERKREERKREEKTQPANGSVARWLGVQVDVFPSLYQSQNLSNRIVVTLIL